MWFLGAGASASAGIPTAWHMTWEFKQKLFISQRKVSAESVADLSNGRIRKQLQAHIDSAGNLPILDHPEEYAALFEAVFPSEADRRSYLDSKVSGAKPSLGHLGLATLMRADLTKLIWTTNFDSLVADAAAKLYDSTGPLSVIDLDAPELAAQLIGDGRWPIEVKIHGDFRSRQLKNTDDELRHQDARLRKVLVDSCRRFGLVVAGYSGRDESVMDTLEDALADEGAFPSGLFWLHCGTGEPLPRVTQLLERAQDAKVEAAIVSIDNFDEMLRDLLRLIDVETKAMDEFASDRARFSPAPRPNASKRWPVVRLNGIPVVEAPTVCRRVDCNVGGFAETRQAVLDADVDILVSRLRSGVLCFGSDADVRKAFAPYGINEFDLHTIQDKRLRYESAEHGLLRDAMRAALVRDRAFDAFRRRNLDLIAPNDVQAPEFSRLRSLVGDLSGVMKDHPELCWREGLGVRLEWANGQLWLVFEPHTVFEPFEKEHRGLVADYSRERMVQRYNRNLNDVLDFWAGYIAGNGDPIRALGVSEGVDAAFKLSNVTAYSSRATA
ncbi:MAG: SIR2 family protein [Rhodopirellula sp.]|nr:SIR2 family protein [Rhodopirellula sp.]